MPRRPFSAPPVPTRSVMSRYGVADRPATGSTILSLPWRSSTKIRPSPGMDGGGGDVGGGRRRGGGAGCGCRGGGVTCDGGGDRSGRRHRVVAGAEGLGIQQERHQEGERHHDGKEGGEVGPGRRSAKPGGAAGGSGGCLPGIPSRRHHHTGWKTG